MSSLFTFIEMAVGVRENYCFSFLLPSSLSPLPPFSLLLFFLFFLPSFSLAPSLPSHPQGVESFCSVPYPFFLTPHGIPLYFTAFPLSLWKKKWISVRPVNICAACLGKRGMFLCVILKVFAEKC